MTPITRALLLLPFLTAAALLPARTFAVRQSGGAIHGRVSVPAGAVAMPRPAVAAPSTAAHPTVDRRRVVVYLESAPRPAFSEFPASRARMDQRAEQFVPRLLAITVGTTVEFPNNDKTFHNVFSLSRARTFDLGRFPPGRAGAVRFDRPGIVPVFCDIHTHMSAYILVFTHPFFAVSDTDGRYEIPNVPPGSYTLMVWSELGTASPRRVTVPESGAIDADFQVGREP